MKFLAFRPDFADFAAALRCGTMVGSVVGSAVERALQTHNPRPRFPLTATKLSRRIIKWIPGRNLLNPQDRFKLR